MFSSKALCGAILLTGSLLPGATEAVAQRLVGTPVQVSENRGRLAVEIDGQPFIAAFALDNVQGQIRNSLLIIDPINGETEQHWYPEREAANDSLFHMLRASNGNLYATIGHTLVEFDLREREWSFEGAVDGLAMSFVEAPDGKIYFGTYPQSTLWEFDPDTRALREIGRLDSVEQYPYTLGADAYGWIYAGIGTGRNNLVAMHPGTGERRQLALESERKTGQGQVQPGEDGYLYGRVHNSAASPWRRLENGQIKVLKDPSVQFASRSNAHFTQMVTEFPSGGRIIECDLPSRTAKIVDKHGVEHEVRFDYVSNGPLMSSLTLGTDGRIYGSTNHPMHFWQYDPEEGGFTDYGGIPEVGGGNFPNLAARGGEIIGATYPGGRAYAFDKAKPWDLENGNPRLLGRYPEISRPRVSLLLNDGKTVAMSGFPGYGYTGGGMVFYDVENDNSAVLTADDLLPGHSTVAMRQLSDGTLVGGTTTQTPGGGPQLADTSLIYLMDPDTREILAQTELGPDVNSLEILSNGNVIGLTRDSRLFIYSPGAREIVLPPGARLSGGPLNPGQSLIRDEDGEIFLILSNSISRVHEDGTVVKLASLPQRARAGTTILDGKLYYASGSQLWVYRLAPPVDAQWINPDGGSFHEPENWDTETVPEEVDGAVFSMDSAYEVQFTEDVAIAGFANRGGDVTFDLGGNSLSMTGRVNFDAAGSGGETIFRNGNLSSQQISLGGEGEEGSSRSLVLEGPELFWEASGHMGIGTTQGYSDPAISDHSVTIRDGAEVNLIGAGNGGGIILGWEGGSNNSFRITGPGSKITMRNMVYVGYQGSGQGNSVYVEDGAWLSSNGIQIGRGGTHDQHEARFVIDGADSRIDAAFVQLGGGTGVGDSTLSSGNILEQRDGLLWLDPDQGTNPNTYLYAAGSGNHIRLLGGTTRVERPVERIGYARALAGNSITVAGGNLITDNLRSSSATDVPIIFHHGSITSIDSTHAVASAPLIVGDGESSEPALYRMNGGLHRYGPNSGLIVESNGEVTGSGNLEGDVTVRGAFGPDGEIRFDEDGSLVFDGGRYVARLDADTLLFGNSGVEFDFATATLEPVAGEGFSAAVGTTFVLVQSWNDYISPFANAPEGTILSAGNGVFVEISYAKTWGELIATVVEPQGETFADWAVRHDLGTDVSPEADPAGDGIANAIKYALGLDPNVPSVLPAATLAEENGERFLTLTVERDPAAIEATLSAESSSDLVNWSSETVAVVSGSGDSVTFRDTVPVGSADRRFLRLTATVD